MARASKDDGSISVLEISQGEAVVNIVGTKPLIMNRMAAKAKRELLLPRGGRKTKADREQTLKHNPVAEYRDSAYRTLDDAAPTRLCFFASAFKSAMATAALDLPGATKTEIGRLSWVEGLDIPVWGVPKLMMSVVRSADIKKTPDIRTRAILPEWACTVKIRYVQPRLTLQAVSNLLHAAGVMVGVGDFRQEKGKGSFGQFRVVGDPDDSEFRRIVSEQGREPQDRALRDPLPYDPDTEELLEWFDTELASRGRRLAA